MRRDTINLFMWGFQRTFRLGVEMGVTSSLSNLGTSVEPVVFLIGVSRTGGVGHPICIEPEDGLLAPEDFSRLTIRAGQLYELDPDSKLIISATWLHERRQQRTLERAFGKAIAEIIERKIGGGIRFFVANPTLVDQHHVYTAIGIPARVLVQTPRLSKRKAADGRIPVTGSLVQGAVDELLRVSARALLEPDAGAGADIGIEPADIARVAGRALTGAAVTLAGNVYGPPFYDALTWVSTTSYEQRVGLGRLVIADPGSEYVDRILTLRDSIPVTETRTLRKMLELSSSRSASLLTDGARVYGLGHMRDDYDPVSESVFEVVVVGHGSWDLRHAETTLMTVRNGAPRLPQPRLSRHRFDDITHRVFASTGGCDSDAVWELAMAAADARYGTMVVVSATAATEAERLRSQAVTVEPGRLAPDVVRQVTSIDGAVLVDPNAACHAIGVILDGTATREGDRSRGARYNSAVRYLASAPAATVIILVSEDRMVDLLPDLRPLMRRSHLQALMSRLRDSATADPLDAERFYKAYERVKAASFYLSPEQCAEANTLRVEHWKRRKAAGAQVRAYDTPLVPNPEMSEAYLTD